MGDFLIDLRESTARRTTVVIDSLRFTPRTEVHHFQEPGFSAAVTVPDDPARWAPFTHPDNTTWVAVVGRVALDSAAWDTGVLCPGTGGIAAKAIDALFRKGGLTALENLSGNFALLICDRPRSCLHLITDCSGVFPAFETTRGSPPVFGSHPDALAACAGERDEFDTTSIAEFLLTGTVSPPFTYYRNIRAVDRASVISIHFPGEGKPRFQRRCYFPFEFRGASDDREEDLADELATAFRNAVARRTRREFGRCAIALSGGLDSRAVLASLHPSADPFAFTCFDADNLEVRSARSIANAAGVAFHPFQRPFEYYGDNASEGMRISGGMGSLANNHFLGTLPWLHENGVQSLLTGCYCDYLFKGLPLNRRTHPVTGLEELAPFRSEFYFSHHWPNTPRAREVRDRIESRYPERVRNSQADEDIFHLETLRTFPLCYEGDNAQRVVPQRLTGWFLPVSDPDLLRVYCRIPYRWKLNRSIFSRAVRSICGSRFDRIPDANTGARVGARWWSTAANSAILRLKARLSRFRPTQATQGSWPNWPYYTRRSDSLPKLLARPSPLADLHAREVLGTSLPPHDFSQCSESQMWVLLKVLSFRLWTQNRW